MIVDFKLDSRRETNVAVCVQVMAVLPYVNLTSRDNNRANTTNVSGSADISQLVTLSFLLSSPPVSPNTAVPVCSVSPTLEIRTRCSGLL